MKTFLRALLLSSFALTLALAQATPILNFMARNISRNEVFRSAPTTITVDNVSESVGLFWDSTNTTYCTKSGTGWSGIAAVQSEFQFNPVFLAGQNTLTYTLTCTGLGGNVSGTITVQLVGNSGQTPSLAITYPTGNETFTVGQQAVVTWQINNLSNITSQTVWVSLDNGANFTPIATIAGNLRSLVWNVPSTASNQVILSVTVKDGTNNYRMQSNTFRIVSPGDTTPPMVSILSPTANQTVSGNVTVTANATDNIGVVGVKFLIDSAETQGTEMTTPPYAFVWNTANFANGYHTISAIARDAAGYTATSSPVTVLVNNAPQEQQSSLRATFYFPSYPVHPGQQVTVTISEVTGISTWRVFLTTDGATFSPLSDSLPVNTTSFTWNVPASAAATNNAQLRVVGTTPTGSQLTVSSPVFSLAAQQVVPQYTSVVNSASFNLTPLVPCMLATIMGSNLATASVSGAHPFQTTLGNSQVLVNGSPAYITYASPSQINFQVPCSVGIGTTLSVQVTNSNVAGPSISIPVVRSAPALYRSPEVTGGPSKVIVTGADGNRVTEQSAIKRGSYVIVYGTGFGTTTPTVNSGALAPGLNSGEALARHDLPLYVIVGGRMLPASPNDYVGFVPGLIGGLTQVNFRIPDDQPVGLQSVVVLYDSQIAGAFNLNIQQ